MVPRCVLVSVAVLVVVGYGDACHAGWFSLGSKCYHASIDREDWTGAKIMCELFGGELAEVPSKAVNDFITNLAKVDNKTAGFWVGMTDAEVEDTWQWVASKTVLSADGYTNWASGEPNNGKHDQNCVFLKMTDQGHWYDGKCHNVKDYICQMDDSGTGGIVG